MELMTTKALDSFLDVTFIGLVLLALLTFLTRYRARKKGKTPFLGSWRIVYAVIGVFSFGFFQAVGFNLGWIVLNAVVLKYMWDDYKYAKQTDQWLKASSTKHRPF